MGRRLGHLLEHERRDRLAPALVCKEKRARKENLAAIKGTKIKQQIRINQQKYGISNQRGCKNWFARELENSVSVARKANNADERFDWRKPVADRDRGWAAALDDTCRLTAGNNMATFIAFYGNGPPLKMDPVEMDLR